MELRPRIEVLTEKKLIGIRLIMSMADNKTRELWKSFMPRIKEIPSKKTDNKISMQVYKNSYFIKFNPYEEFEKWATVEVNNFHKLPNGLETFILKGGLYAVFDYKGLSSDNRIFQYIFTQWIPQSDYILDDRPHFEVLGKKYKNNDPNSEEEIWIPIKAIEHIDA